MKRSAIIALSALVAVSAAPKACAWGAYHGGWGGGAYHGAWGGGAYHSGAFGTTGVHYGPSGATGYHSGAYGTSPIIPAPMARPATTAAHTAATAIITEALTAGTTGRIMAATITAARPS